MKLITSVVAFLLTIALVSCTAEEQVQVTTDSYVNVDMTQNAYVGSETCRNCHLSEYKAWRTTAHSRMGSDVSKNPNAYITEYNPEKIRTELLALEEKGKLKVKAEEIYIPEKSEILYTLGSDWKQRYVIKKDGILYVAPFQYYINSGTWNGYNEHNWDTRPWLLKCGGCHVTGVELNPEDHAASTFNEPGIGCEACHGPGLQHASLPASDVLRKLETIVNPAKLPIGQAAQVCGSCHIRGTSTKVEGANFPVGYTPGKALMEYYDPTSYEDGDTNRHYPNAQSKSHHQQYQDWLLSKHAIEGVGCQSCHYSHDLGEQKNGSQTRNAPGSKSCFTCHTMVNRNKAHSIHSFANCLGCHMPRIAKSTDHNDIRSHSFEVFTPEVTIENPENPNSCQSCHQHQDEDLIELNERFLQLTKLSPVSN